MANLGGKHKQAGNGRDVTYWCAFDVMSDEAVAVVAVFHEDMRSLGTVYLTLASGPDHMPIDLRVRSALMSYIDRTEFGEGTLPDPRWIGWKPGAYV